MTTEDDFQRQLDADPNDHFSRGVLADWLEERDDRRAAGYRCLSAMRRRPHVCSVGITFHNGTGSCDGDLSEEESLPQDWIDAMVGEFAVFSNSTKKLKRRQVEDDAAIAFLKLPPERQAELLAGATEEVSK